MLELQQWIDDQRKAGRTDEELRAQAIAHGWDEGVVARTIDKLQLPQSSKKLRIYNLATLLSILAFGFGLFWLLGIFEDNFLIQVIYDEIPPVIGFFILIIGCVGTILFAIKRASLINRKTHTIRYHFSYVVIVVTSLLVIALIYFFLALRSVQL
jgi:hypothetical protein